jgi:crossover junction endodeoxyribonuclease RuvC
MRILGIDPGSNATGFGIVDRVEGRAGSVRHVAHGVLRPPRSASLAKRLAYLHQGLTGMLQEFKPEASAVEQVFVSTSPRSALVLGHARGVALAALASFDISVREVAAREVKKAVVGTGAASKAQVQSMVSKLLLLETTPASDAADALAVAICEAHAGPLAALGLRSGSRRRRRFTAAELAGRLEK